MTTEAPDGPMPLCMSPEAFRAAVDRAKKAERERDEALANVATLVEQLGEAERRAANSESLRDGALDRLAEVERERDGLQRPRAGERLKMWDRLYAAVGADDDWTAEQVVRAVESLAGAAQPVVGPRDETRDGVGERTAARLEDVAVALEGEAATLNANDTLDGVVVISYRKCAEMLRTVAKMERGQHG